MGQRRPTSLSSPGGSCRLIAHCITYRGVSIILMVSRAIRTLDLGRWQSTSLQTRVAYRLGFPCSALGLPITPVKLRPSAKRLPEARNGLLPRRPKKPMTWGLSGLDPAQARRLAAVFTSMLLRDEGTKHLKLRQKQPQSRSERKDSLHFRTRAPSIEGIQRLRIWPPCTTKARWNNPAPKGSRLTHWNPVN